MRDSVTTTTDENTVTQQFYTTSYKRAHLLGAIFVRGVDGKSLMGDPLCVSLFFGDHVSAETTFTLLLQRLSLYIRGTAATAIES